MGTSFHFKMYIFVQPKMMRDPLAKWRQIITEKESVALGLCFKHCYGNQCGKRASDELRIDWEEVETIFHDNFLSGLK